MDASGDAQGAARPATSAPINIPERDRARRRRGADAVSASPRSVESVIELLQDDLKCAVCLEFLESPLALPCLHSFCKHCLHTLVASNGNRLACPICRELCDLGAEGIDSLKTDYRIQAIAEKLRSVKNIKSCVECTTTLSTVHCFQCNAYLCDRCSDERHGVSSALQIHVCVPVLDALKIKEIQKLDARDDHRPVELIVPFSIGKQMCVQLTEAWFQALWFAPRGLPRAKQSEFKPCFLPFWTFNVDARSRVSGWVGFLDEFDRSKPVTCWRAVVGDFTESFAEVRVVAATGDAVPVLLRLEPWKFHELHPLMHECRCVGGVPVHFFACAVTAEAAWQNEGQHIVAKRSDANSAKRLRLLHQGDRLRDFKAETSFTNRRSMRVYVPLYMSTYEFGGASYNLYLNGQTGQIHGERPYSAGKLASVGIGSIGAVITLFASRAAGAR